MENITYHAMIRMAQRAIGPDDLELIITIGTEVSDGYLVREKDCQEFERKLKRLRDKIRRLNGKRVVIAGNRIVTAYHASRNKRRYLLRDAEEQAMSA